VLALVQRKTRYVGWMKWHYWSGVASGLFAMTWTFSGLLSIEPAGWARLEPGANEWLELTRALSGGPLDLTQYARFESSVWQRALGPMVAKEITLRRIQGDAYYDVHGDAGASMLVSPVPPGGESADPPPGQSLRAARSPFTTDEIVGRIRNTMSAPSIASTELMGQYDAYYYDRGRGAPLPVLRIVFDDPAGTWMYIDVSRSTLVASVTRRQRVERWLYHGLHSLDFSFWYYNRPLWLIGVTSLCSGGALLSAIGVVIGFRRLRRGLRAAR
jgi:hypothetical protein